MKSPRPPLFLILAIFFNILAWQLVVPIWHFPDEQAHFGQVAFRAEHGRVQAYHELSTSLEIMISEELLGTKRDTLGNNRFTYHPEYKIDYSQNYDGIREAEIESLNNSDYRKKEVLEESTRYPLLYYYFASKIYNLFGENDLFTRVYAVRFFSLVIFLGTALTIFAISKLIFPKDFFLQISLTSIVSFMPMFVFSSAGVTSDSLFHFLFLLALYEVIKITFVKFSIKDALLLFAVIIAGIATKFQFQIIWPVIAFAILIIFWRLQFRKKLIFLGFLVIFLPTVLIAINFLRFFVNDYGTPTLRQLMRLPLIPETSEGSTLNPVAELSIASHIILTMKRTLRETLPWYFGVYKWLSLTLPPLVYRIINRILILSMIGLVVWIFKLMQLRKFDQQAKVLIFLGYSAISYFGALTLFDWLFYKYHGFYFGIQGRYFFPTIIAHISLVFVGLLKLSPKSFKRWVAAILVLATIIFNYFSLFWIASHYYNMESLQTFIIQASQYKPEIFKGPGLILIMLGAFLSTAIFLFEYLRVTFKTKSANFS